MTSNGAAASARPKFKTSFKSLKTYSPIHSGGKVDLSGDSKWMVTTLNEQALVSDRLTGERLGELAGDSSPVTTLAITPSPASPTRGGFIITASRSLALHIYALPSLTLHRTIPKAHESPIITCAADPTGTLFATGSADGIVKVWDAERGHCTHVFRGHGGVISALCFDIARPRTADQVAEGVQESAEDTSGRARLVSAADDCKIRVWDLRTRECLEILDGHVSVIRGLAMTPDGNVLVSGGRDKVINVWSLRGRVKGSAELIKTMPVFETLEKVGLVPSLGGGRGFTIFSGGDKGVVRLWDLKTGSEIETREGNGKSKVHEILDVIYSPLVKTLTAVYVDQNIITRTLPHLVTTQQIIGYNDEVIDTVLLSTHPGDGGENALAVATNSDLIRIYNLQKFSVDLLEGHQDVVLCLSKSADGHTLVSGSKDKTARIWQVRPRAAAALSSLPVEASSGDGADNVWMCLGVCEGHVESVGAVAVSQRALSSSSGFIITASQDRTAKIWDLASALAMASGEVAGTTLPQVRSLATAKIHDKDINSLDVSPNDALLASGSQDRTAKLFRITYTPSTSKSPATASLTPLGIFKGHKRGVWSVKFSSVDQCLATASGDRTVKLWNLGDFSCIKTFEGHSNSVLRVDFLTQGMQLVSCASDGLVKVWNVKDEECVATLDGHDEKIWALTISKDEKTIVSGGADSVITFWEDVTLEQELERTAAHESLVLQEQDFENYLSINDYSNAILLALSMDQPRRLLKLFTALKLDPLDQESLTGSSSVDSVIKALLPDELAQMMGYIKDWNTSARTAEIAQCVLHAILKTHSAGKVLEALEGKSKAFDQKNLMEIEGNSDHEDDTPAVAEKKRRSRIQLAKKRKTLRADEVLGALIPYTERHFSRSDKMVRESFIVEHLLGMMQSFEQLEDDMEGVEI